MPEGPILHPEPSQKKPRVSVVCAWFNRADVLQETVNALLEQNHDSFEVVVVNDGSTDPRVRDLLDGYSDPRLIAIHQENGGFVKAIKAAIKASSGSYIAIQGAGDVSLQGRLTKQSDLLDMHPAVGIVGCMRAEVVYGGTEHGASAVSPTPTRQPMLDDLLYRSNPFSHGEVMFRRAIYDQVGGYRDFFKFAQDRDLWIRMAPFCEMRVIAEVLYERRAFVADGIASNHGKLALQQAFSNFARQCHFDRIANGRDFIELYGVYGGLFRRPSASYARSLAKMSIQSYYSGNTEKGQTFARWALSEKATGTTIATSLASWVLSRSTVILSLFRTLLSKHPKSAIWPRS